MVDVDAPIKSIRWDSIPGHQAHTVYGEVIHWPEADDNPFRSLLLGEHYWDAIKSALPDWVELTPLGIRADLFIANVPEAGNLRSAVDAALASIDRANIVARLAD